MILTVVFYIFVVCTAIQIVYYIIFSSFLFIKKQKTASAEQVPISVIIFVKNKAAELQKNIPLLLAQKYPKFELVLINNESTDNTSEVLEKLKLENDTIKILDVENNEAFWGNIKYALTLGIKTAKYEHLLFTTIDSEPLSEFWISEMSKQFKHKKTIVLGYTKYKKESSLSNLVIRFDNLLTAIKCFSFAKIGNPFMAFDGNLAYKKSTFFSVKGFINHIKIKRGENDLFIRDAATQKNCTYTFSKNSLLETSTPNSFTQWFYQQRKHQSIKKHYKFKHRFLLAFFTFTKFMVYVLSAILFFLYSWQIILAILLPYFLIQIIIIGISSKKLNEPYLVFALPFLEIGLLLIQITIFSANLISKPNH